MADPYPPKPRAAMLAGKTILQGNVPPMTLKICADEGLRVGAFGVTDRDLPKRFDVPFLAARRRPMDKSLSLMKKSNSSQYG
jgi:hypothetical protein